MRFREGGNGSNRLFTSTGEYLGVEKSSSFGMPVAANNFRMLLPYWMLINASYKETQQKNSMRLCVAVLCLGHRCGGHDDDDDDDDVALMLDVVNGGKEWGDGGDGSGDSEGVVGGDVTIVVLLAI